MAQVGSDKILRTAMRVRRDNPTMTEEEQLSEVCAQLGPKFDASKVKSRVNQLRKRLEDIVAESTDEAAVEKAQNVLDKMPSYAAGKRGKKFDVDALNSIADEFGDE